MIFDIEEIKYQRHVAEKDRMMAERKLQKSE